MNGAGGIVPRTVESSRARQATRGHGVSGDHDRRRGRQRALIRRRALERRARDTAAAGRSIASAPAGSPIRSGRRATARHAIFSSSQEEACSLGQAPTARSSASPAIRHGRRSSPGPPRRQVHRARARNLRADRWRHQQPRKARRPRRRCRQARNLRVGTFAMPVRRRAGGVIRWRAAGKLARSRSPRAAATPPRRTKRWSDWSGVYTNPEGEPMKSPHARYLQWRAVFTSDRTSSPSLTSVTAAYLPRNLRPDVGFDHGPSAGNGLPASVLNRRAGDCRLRGQYVRQPSAHSVSPPASESAPSFAHAGARERICQKGLQTIVWKADDGNDDRLQCDVLCCGGKVRRRGRR